MNTPEQQLVQSLQDLSEAARQYANGTCSLLELEREARMYVAALEAAVEDRHKTVEMHA